jgi:hypothetical protein
MIARMMPRRWFYVAFVVLFFTGMAALFVPFFAAPRGLRGFPAQLGAADPTTVTIGLAIAAASGLVLGVLAVSSYARHDQRLAIVRERMPRAYVFQARKDIGTQDFLRWALKNPRLKLKMQFTVSVDHEGVIVWTGSNDPVGEGMLAWSRIEEIGPAMIPKSKFGAVYPGLEFVVADDYESRSQVIGVEGKPRNITQATIGAEADVVAALAEIRSVLGQAPIAAPQTVESYMTVAMPRRTAYWAQRRAFLPFAGTTAIGGTIATGGIGTWFATGDPTVAIVFGVTGLLLIVTANVMRFRVTSAEARERAAGYTTLNAANLDLDQRHPRTGIVMRNAYAPALTKPQFADALRRGIR